MQTALARWHEVHDARARQMDAVYAKLGRTSADMWKRRAGGYQRATRDSARNDPFFQQVRSDVTPTSELLDVGAGTGRFALALAPYVAQVTAVEPSEAMLRYLRADAAAQGLKNFSFVSSTWQEAPAELRADVVICSHVLYPIREVDLFLQKLYAATRGSCYIYMRGTQLDALSAHIWRFFHGDERLLSPGYIHALDVLFELGFYADVKIVHKTSSMRFSSLDGAVDEMLEMLILPDDERTRELLRTQISQWLVPRGEELVPPQAEVVSAILKLSRTP